MLSRNLMLVKFEIDVAHRVALTKIDETSWQYVAAEEPSVMMDLAYTHYQSEQQIAASMENVLRTFLWAVNNRCFAHSPQSKDFSYHAVWEHFADDFVCETEYVGTVPYTDQELTPPLVFREGGQQVIILGREKLKDMFRVVVDTNPDYRISDGPIDTLVYKKLRWAVSYISMETHGMPLGVVRPSLGVCDWALVDGHWRIRNYKGMTGISTQ
ncbi:hypothetical protein PRZ48_002880 [Zasmidium cellare]|uniref:Uncharacterized protein n=1 Tax=Zasmidium cellare TaxID=395010 RepID=A0ABR0ETG5_ZASCE|nr:hypothetical protein PRZ48_002880 [Zasmidium cellare]